jgi:hypothetical protein
MAQARRQVVLGKLSGHDRAGRDRVGWRHDRPKQCRQQERHVQQQQHQRGAGCPHERHAEPGEDQHLPPRRAGVLPRYPQRHTDEADRQCDAARAFEDRGRLAKRPDIHEAESGGADHDSEQQRQKRERHRRLLEPFRRDAEPEHEQPEQRHDDVHGVHDQASPRSCAGCSGSSVNV